MASNNVSCCDSKKQKMNNQTNHNHAHTNGHSHNNGNSHNGHMNGFNGVNGVSKHLSEDVALPEMCLFCFEVLHCELNNIEGPPEPNFTNDSL